MYYPVGWPKVLLANDVEDGKPVQILQHPRKELILVVREKSVSLWHTRVSETSVFDCKIGISKYCHPSGNVQKC